jgi:hypothetical protein
MNGLKSLARELPQYGRYNDDMVAHISLDEARLLKSLGGSGTINPTTGLPEFGMFGIGGGGGFLGTGINKNASDPVSNALSNNPVSKGVSSLVQSGAGAIDQGLVGLDKTVGKAIPGGWGTVGMVAASMIPGMTPLMMGGLGAINGSGVLRKGGKFNLQGAMMGGAMAYGMSSLAQYAQGAAPTPDMSGATAPTSGGITPTAPDAINSLQNSTGNFSQGMSAPGSSIPQSAIDAANAVTEASAKAAQNFPINEVTNVPFAETGSGLAGNGGQPSIGSQVMNGEFGKAATQLGQNVQQSAYDAYNSLGDFAKKAITPSTYENALSNYGANVAKTGEGAYNLITGAPGASAAAATNATAQGLTSPMMATAATLYGATGLAGLEEQRKLLDEQKATNAISQAEYDKAMAEITRSEDVARNAVKENPFSTNPNRDVSIGDTYYGRTGANENLYARNNSTLYAAGGGVDSLDDQTDMPNRSPVDGLAMGGMGYAAGGQIDMGNGRNPFANLPYMNGPLGNVGQQLGGGDILPPGATPIGPAGPFVNMPRGFDSTNTTTQQDIMGGNRNGISGGLSSIFTALGGTTPFSTSNINATPQPIMQAPSIYNASTDQFSSAGSQLGGSSGYPSAAGYGGGSSAFPLEGQYGIVKMAAGGTARFLSGGGDGMSDSIPATIEGKQEARLADGEFVIPADVVSHLGNGSSKAGAKQLYSMMDKVRKARTGNPKQGKQINPRKYLAA